MIYIFTNCKPNCQESSAHFFFFLFFFHLLEFFCQALFTSSVILSRKYTHEKSGALYAKVKKQAWKRQANQTNAWNKKYMCISSNYGYKSLNLKPEYLWCLCPLHIWKLKKPYTDLTILQSTIKIPCQAIFKNGPRTSILTVNMWKSHNNVTCK